jgi:hypothetical protein
MFDNNSINKFAYALLMPIKIMNITFLMLGIQSPERNNSLPFWSWNVNVSWHVNICLGMSICVWACQYVSGHVNMCLGMSICVLACQYMYWHVNKCIGMSICVSTE